MFLFTDPTPTETSTLSLHDALPISMRLHEPEERSIESRRVVTHLLQGEDPGQVRHNSRSEEHTSELQSPDHLVWRLLLEKNKNDERMKGIRSVYRTGGKWIRARTRV